MKNIKQWKEDPIVEEVHQLAKQMEKDPRAFRERINARALNAGMQVSELEPVSLKKVRENKHKAKKNGSR